MKRLFTYSMAITMAALVLYGGSGLNVMNFCCNNCRAAGMLAVAGMTHHTDGHENHDSCCEGHAGESATSACSNHANRSDKGCCSFKHISFDWNLHNTPKLVTDQFPVSIDMFANELGGSYICFSLSGEHKGIMPDGPPLFIPRDYLSLLTVLLI